MGRATADETYLALRREARSGSAAYEGQVGRATDAPPAPDAGAVRAALAAMLRQAQECGQMAPHSSQRRYARYAFHSRVEIRRAVDDESAALLGSLHDLSSGGMSVWAPLAANPGDRLAIRIWPRSQAPVWVEVTVEHCNEGRGGVLIGASFDEPLEGETPQAQVVAAPPPAAAPSQTVPAPALSSTDFSPGRVDEPREPSTDSDAEVVAALLDLLQEARDAGDVDQWNGKRRNPRYSFSPKLELLRDGQDAGAAVPATLYNVSRCGVALWSRQAFLPGTFIHMRVWPPNQPSTWVPVQVEHCERGLRGFLIGASYPVRLPAEVDEAIQAESDSATEHEPLPRVGTTLFWLVAAVLAAFGAAALLR